jgi:hypothetical protein
MSEADLAAKKSLVRASDIINYQFTSGEPTATLMTSMDARMSNVLYRHHGRPESGHALTCVRKMHWMA